MEDITRMIRTNIKSNHIQIENLCKSIFSNIDNISYEIRDKKITVLHLDPKNSDSASIEFTEDNGIFKIIYWDGYSLAEEFNATDIKSALKNFKRFSKKLYKNLKKFS